MKTITVQQFKQSLPDIKVLIKGKIVNGIVRGRKNKFATVYPETISYMYIEAAWEIAVDCFNNDVPLRIIQ